jgi:DNA topoisomerase-1
MNYLNDNGIYQKKNKYYYHSSNRVVSNRSILDRIDSIYVPPAWTSVWYASSPKTHIQVHGVDESGKKQYILSEAHIEKSKTEKYKRMKNFIKDLDRFKRVIRLSECGDTASTKTDTMHLLFWLLMETHIRVGNEMYVPESYGLTTMRQKHLKSESGHFSFEFVGKSKIIHTVAIPKRFNQYMSKLILNKPNHHVFWYLDGTKRVPISSDELNEYLKQHMGSDYTCKDFRTYSANVLFIKAFLKNECQHSNPKRFVLKCIDESADQLGHSRSISRKSYISGNLLTFCIDRFDQARGSTMERLIKVA